MDGSVEHLKKKLNQGYQLCVFPEGKRSFTNKIGRFHKGAFYLQQQLKIDILPIYIHGNSEVMPKGDFMIHSGNITVKVGKRIPYDSTDFGETERERTKGISAFFKSNFLNFRKELEKPDYYKRILFSNYKYKETDIISLVKDDFDTNKNVYHSLNEIVPMRSKILHIANDFGQIDILLISKYLDRKITSFIKDKNKQPVARNCYTNKKRRVEYISAMNNLDYSIFDTLLLTNSESESIIDNSKLENFKKIIIVNRACSVEKIIALGFKIIKEKDQVVLLEK